MLYEVKNRATGDVQFTAEIDCKDDAPTSLKLGLSVKWAVRTGADLRRANLRGAYLGGAYLRGADLGDANLRGAYLGGADLGDANLRGAYLGGADLRRANLRGAYLGGANLRGADLGDANLRGADLTDADLIDAGQRSDGWRFVGWVYDGELRVIAGCRNYTIEQARKHWGSEDYRSRALADETLAKLDMIEATAKIRKMI